VRFTDLGFRGADLRVTVRRAGAPREISGTASINLAEAPDNPRTRADLTNVPTKTPSSKARPALSLGWSRTALAKADNKAFDRAAIAIPRWETASQRA
jgi:hypothetical protein